LLFKEKINCLRITFIEEEKTVANGEVVCACLVKKDCEDIGEAQKG